jgi:hypothetical protein
MWPSTQKICGFLSLHLSLIRPDNFYRNTHLPFSSYEHLCFYNAMIFTLCEPILHICYRLYDTSIHNFNLFYNSSVFYICFFVVSYPEDDLKNRKMSEREWILCESVYFNTYAFYCIIYQFWLFLTFCWPCISHRCAGWEKTLFTQPVHRTATYRCNDTRCCIIQFWPPDDEHIALETCRGV